MNIDECELKMMKISKVEDEERKKKKLVVDGTP
jgi:hypothetical protein